MRPYVTHLQHIMWATGAAISPRILILSDTHLFHQSFSFFDNMSRIMSKDYVPTFNDVLRSRVRTTGIIETQIQVDDVSYR